MAEEGFKRKLAAILSADVKGYSRLMGDAEGATVRTLTAYREVFITLLKPHSRIQVFCAQNPGILANLSQNSVSTIRPVFGFNPVQ